jgi:nucleoside-diphosphate-sugar epimerase
MRFAAWRVLIAGYGFVGRALGRRLSEHGCHVWGIRRSHIDYPENVEVVAADLSRPLDPALIPKAPDYVVYLLSSDDRTDAAYHRARVEGLRNLFQALEASDAHPLRLFYASSTGVYPHSDGSWVDEHTPVTPTGFEGSRLLEGEAIARSGRFPATVVRFAGIYGAGRIRLLRKIARGEPTCTEGPPIYSNRIHVEDCAAVLEHLMQLEKPRELYLASDDEPVDRCELARWLAGALGVPAAKPLPREGHHPDHRNKRCSNRRLKESGYRFLYPPFRQGYRQIIDRGFVE